MRHEVSRRAEKKFSGGPERFGRFAESAPGSDAPRQQPDGDRGDTPGVASAPVALAGAIMPGVDRFIVTLWAQAAVFGVGTTVIVGSMLVLASPVTAA
jgi:hypothetical protein